MPVEDQTEKSVSTIDYLKRHFQNFMIMTTMNMKLKDPGVTNNEANVADNFKHGSSTKSSYTSFESKKAYLIDDQNWQSLSYYHWLTLFSYYNVSLYNRYVAILPQINLYKLVKQSDILKYRNQNEIKNYNSVLTVDDELRFRLENLNESDKVYHDFKFKLDEQQNSTDSQSYRSALVELIGIVILGIPTIILVVYLLIVLYKCLCSKKYEIWRKKWSTSSIKRQYKIIHSKMNRSPMINDAGVSLCCCNIPKQDCCDCRSDSDFERSGSKNHQSDCDSECEDSEADDGYFSLKRKNSLGSDLNLNESNSIDKDDMLNKIINGQKNDIDLAPYKIFNSDEEFRNDSLKHNYPLDLISSTGSSLLASSDLSNEIKVWSLGQVESGSSNDLFKSVNLNDGNCSIWTMCLTDDDKFIFIGQSDGLIKNIDLETNQIECCGDQQNLPGITHLLQIKSKLNKTDSFYQSQKSSLLLQSSIINQFSYLILLSRLNGYLELVEFSNNGIKFLCNLRVHNCPITNIFYANGGDYLMTTGQDLVLNIVKINTSKLKSQQFQTLNTEKELTLMFDVSEHGDSMITSMCIDKENTINAATGSEDGIVCLWNLFTGECKFKLTNTKKRSNEKDSKSATIVRLEISQNLVVSLSSDQQMCIWNRTSGKLIKEFKFFEPLFLSNKSLVETCENSVINSWSSNFMSLLRNFTNSRKHHEHSDQILNEDLLFRPIPSMCLYSKTILVTGGCSCIFLWNILKGELIKKLI